MLEKVPTRTLIEQAAIALFAKKGVDATTTRDLAEATGLAEGTLYRHFKSKDDLIEQLFRHHYGALTARLDRDQAAEAGIAATLDAMIGMFCRLFDETPELFTFLLLTQHRQISWARTEGGTAVDVVCRVIAEAVALGELPDQDPELATALVFGVVLQPALSRIYGRISGTMTDLQPELLRAACRVLGLATLSSKRTR